MTTSIHDNAEETRFEITVDGELAGYVDYTREGDEYALPHTRVFSQFEGRGIGGQLITGALTEIASRGGSVLPFCPFVNGYISRHPEYVSLVPEDFRAEFGL